MSGGALLAAAGAACAVVAAWDALALVEGATVSRALARAAAPLRAARAGGVEPTSPERRRLACLGALALLAGGWLVAGPGVGVACAAAGPWAARTLVRARRRRWRRELARSAPAVARALADALSGGHSVRGAIQHAAHGGGLEGAAAVELARAAEALAYGERTEDVLRSIARRAGDPAYDTIAAAVLLQREAGGDLASLLRTVAASVEAAGRVRAEAQSATAQARFTAFVVAALPAAGLVLAELADPGHLASMLGDPLPAALVAAALALEAAALLLVNRLARVPA